MSNKPRAIVVFGAAQESKTLDRYVSEGNSSLLVLRKTPDNTELDFFNQLSSLFGT